MPPQRMADAIGELTKMKTQSKDDVRSYMLAYNASDNQSGGGFQESGFHNVEPLSHNEDGNEFGAADSDSGHPECKENERLRAELEARDRDLETCQRIIKEHQEQIQKSEQNERDLEQKNEELRRNIDYNNGKWNLAKAKRDAQPNSGTYFQWYYWDDERRQYLQVADFGNMAINQALAAYTGGWVAVNVGWNEQYQKYLYVEYNFDMLESRHQNKTKLKDPYAVKHATTQVRMTK